ncbi:MAG TPA: 3-deoxy-7-phosphoheptulonate synthase, partial [Actinomycetota bacterium]|nr:3-deoxy-7-phosphoheptulonate synthase [Actinomycetota bacterium]
MTLSWSPTTWRNLPAQQQPDWQDAGELEAALKELGDMPPLVFAGEARSLKAALARAAAGEAFLLQAGDCTEAFG